MPDGHKCYGWLILNATEAIAFAPSFEARELANFGEPASACVCKRF